MNKKNFSIFMGIFILLCAVIIFGISYLFMKAPELSTVELENVKLVYSGDEVELEKAQLVENELGTQITSETTTLDLDGIPIYYTQTDGLILSTDMILVQPEVDLLPYKIEKYTNVQYWNETIMFKKGNAESGVNSGFLYDGKDTYIFLEPAVLVYRGENMELDPLSYVYMIKGSSINVYNPVTGSKFYSQVGEMSVTVQTGGYNVDVVDDSYEDQNGMSLLFTNPDNFSVYKDR